MQEEAGRKGDIRGNWNRKEGKIKIEKRRQSENKTDKI